MGAAEELGGRGRLARVVGVLALVLIALLVALAPVPAYVLRPGPLFSLTEVMSVDGRSADDLAGDVVFTTIAAQDATTFDLLRAAVDPDLTAVSQSSLVPPGVDEDTFVAQQQARFRESEDLAGQAVAALLGVGEVAIEVDARPISTFGCDGVVMATPTGSTAYSFSAGGPIVWPTVDALLMVPLSAHALFARPLVVAPDSALAVELLGRAPGTGVLWCDGRRTFDLPHGARVVVRRSPVPVRLARLSTGPFTERLVNKFNLPVDGWRGPREADRP